MASTSSISGLVSGLDTTTLINQLMQVAAAPQARLQDTLSSTTDRTKAAQGINAGAASLATAAAALASADTYSTAKATSSSSAVTATVTGAPPAGSLTFKVTKLAATHSIATGPIDPSATGDFVITTGDGSTDTLIQPRSHSAADLVAAINDTADLGVTAQVITDSNNQQRIVLTATASGAASAFSIAGLNTLADGSDDEGTTLISGQDAVVSLGADLSVTSASNTFSNLVPGVDVTVTSDPGAWVTVTTSTDPGAISTKVTSLVTSMNALLGDISRATTLPSSGTASVTSGGLLVGNSTMRDLANQLLKTVSGSVGADSAVLAGLQVTREGEVVFDATTFNAFYESDPATAAQVLTAFGEAVQGVGERASDKYTGSVTAFITGSQSTAKDLGDRISDWTSRLADKRATLTAQYAALETALSRLKSQSDALTQALSGLTSSSN